MQQPTFTVEVEGARHEAKIQQGDITRWELARAEHGWPTADEAPNVYMTFIAWAALKRQGAISRDMPFDYFIDALTDVQLEGADAVDPSPPAPTPDS